MSKKRIPFATGGWVNTQSSGDMPFSGEIVVSKDEQEAAGKLIMQAAVRQLKDGKAVNLGPLGKIRPAVSGKWVEKAEDLALSDMKPKVNYKAGDDIAAAVKGASLSWTTEAETDNNTVTDDDNTQTGGNGNTPSSGELEG